MQAAVHCCISIQFSTAILLCATLAVVMDASSARQRASFTAAWPKMNAHISVKRHIRVTGAGRSFCECGVRAIRHPIGRRGGRKLTGWVEGKGEEGGKREERRGGAERSGKVYHR